MSFLYWVYDETCDSVAESGYVGVSEDAHHRIYGLRSAGTVPKNTKLLILYEGTREECLALERTFRPRRNIGWNRAIGGTAPFPTKHGLRPLGHLRGIVSLIPGLWDDEPDRFDEPAA